MGRAGKLVNLCKGGLRGGSTSAQNAFSCTAEIEMRSWNTESYSTHEQFAYWREVCCEAFVSLDPVCKRNTTAFRGHVDLMVLGGTARTRVKSETQFINRRDHEIRRNPVNFYFANFQRRGTCIVRQDGREAYVKAGDFSLVDTTRPYFLDFRDDWDVLSFRIPRATLHARLDDAMGSTARCVSGAAVLGSVATEFATSLAYVDERLDAAALLTLESSLHDLIAVALKATPEVLERSRATARQMMRQAIKRYIDAHLADPSLSPDGIAARFGISRRGLYLLFEEDEDGGLSGLSCRVREQRLLHAAEDLRAPSDCSVIDVAMRWGFNDMSHFSRLFKRRFGASPRAWRRQTVAPLADL